ncbi:MAG: efflux RND transporter permease subunit [Lautropia sp.]
MKAFERLVDHPVRALVVAIVIVLLGVQAMQRLTVRQYPETTSTTIRVVTPYLGASAELVRGFITTPLEQALATADGIDYMQSASSQGQSVITIRLELGRDPDAATAQILTRIQQVGNRLPAGAENSVLRISTGGDEAAMYLAFLSDVLDPAEITDYLTRAVRPQLETLPGVQEARVFGGGELAMRIWLDPGRMAALGVTATQVREVLAANNFLAPVGETRGETLSISLDANTNLRTVDEFRRLVVREDAGTLVRLSDVAQVRLGAETYDSSVLFDNREVVFMAVSVNPTANLLDAVAGVRERLPRIREQMPSGMALVTVYDSTEAVQRSIDEVVSSLIEALVIVTVVIFLFLGGLRSALVPGVAMPLSIVGAFFAMQMLGYTVNLLTLLALILAIGTVVDDGIVIAENATRHLEHGATPTEAAKRTVRELGSSIVAMNIVVLAVFVPIGFVGGLTGTLFTEFAYTVAAATLMSGVIALTLSPMMCATLLRRRERRTWGTRWVDAAFRRTSAGYARALSLALDARWLVLAVGAALFASVFFMWGASERELAPAEDDGFLLATAQGDPNTSLEQLERWTAELSARVQRFDAVEHVFVVNGAGPAGATGSSAFGGVVMKPWEDRDTTQQALQPQVQKAAFASAGLQAFVVSPPSLPGSGGGAPVQFVVGAIAEPRAIVEQSEALIEQAMRSGKFAFVRSDLKFDRLQSRVEIDRERAAALGIDMRQLAGDLSTLLSGGYVNYFSLDGRSYRVVPQVAQRFRQQPSQVLDYRVATRNGELIPLSSIATLSERVQPRQLLRFNQINSAIISAAPAPGVAIGDAIAFLRDAARQTLPDDYVVDWAGQARQFVDQSNTLLLSFGLAVALMYLTLAAQYGSLRDPAVMLVSVPMSIAGALLFFVLGVVSINIYTQIGLLALIGSIIRHGILLVEFANDIQVDEGLGRRDAMQKAAGLRLRSILMTTLATLFGLIPLLVASSGPGAASRFAISFTLGVGMLVGTVFTLFVVPALYTVVATRRNAEGAPPLEARRAGAARR